jgi:tetratricopeptide (TPR) repeat protein
MTTDLPSGPISLQRAQALLTAGQALEALKLATAVASARPTDADAHYVRGQCLTTIGDYLGAITALTSAAHIAPNREDIGCLLANSLKRTGQLDQARALLTQLATSHRRSAAIEFQFAQIDEVQGKPTEAIAHYRRLLTLAPQFTVGWLNLAALLGEQEDATGALAASRRALALEPDFMPALVNIGSALASLKRYDDALDVFKHTLSRSPQDPNLRLDLERCQFAGGDTEATLQTLTPLLTLHPPLLEAHSLHLLALSHVSNDPTYLDLAHRAFSTAAGAPHPTPWRNTTRSHLMADAPIRLGLVSSDFRRHSVWYFLAPLLDGLAQHDVHLYCYHTDRRSDDVTAQWRRQATHWCEASGLDDDALAARITEHSLDALLCVGGHTMHSRPALFARRLAPAQLSFLGYPGPTGIANIDARITDAIADPPKAHEIADREQPLRLSPSYFCYRPMHTERAKLTSARPPQIVRFGSFNTIQKITSSTLALWTKLLQMIPHSTLTLKSDGLNGSVGQALRAQLSTLGINNDRVITLAWAPTREAHLALYRDIDIALDTFPYNGATTTCEALWMGVPVVSLSGATPASRMGRSILCAANCAQWANDTPAAWLASAAALATDLTALRDGRERLREQISASSLMDENTYVTQFAALLREQLRSREVTSARN